MRRNAYGIQGRDACDQASGGIYRKRTAAPEAGDGQPVLPAGAAACRMGTLREAGDHRRFHLQLPVQSSPLFLADGGGSEHLSPHGDHPV